MNTYSHSNRHHGSSSRHVTSESIPHSHSHWNHDNTTATTNKKHRRARQRKKTINLASESSAYKMTDIHAPSSSNKFWYVPDEKHAQRHAHAHAHRHGQAQVTEPSTGPATIMSNTAVAAIAPSSSSASRSVSKSVQGSSLANSTVFPFALLAPAAPSAVHLYGQSSSSAVAMAIKASASSGNISSNRLNEAFAALNTKAETAASASATSASATSTSVSHRVAASSQAAMSFAASECKPPSPPPHHVSKVSDDAATSNSLDVQNQSLAAYCPRWKASEFQWRRVLMHGTFAEIWLAQHRTTGVRYVLKRFDKHLGRGNRRWHVVYEARLHAQLDHRYILRLHGYIETDNCFALILQYVPRGDLFELYLNSEKAVPTVSAVPEHRDHDHDKTVPDGRNLNKLQSPAPMRKYLAQLCEALCYCHERGIVHCDVKPENMLIDEHDNVRLADWGSAVRAQDLLALGQSHFRISGTPEFLPPELLLCLLQQGAGSQAQLSQLTPSLDMWSVGVLAFELLSVHSPFFRRRGGQQPSIQEMHRAYGRMEKGDLVPPPDFPNDADAFDFVRRLLVFDASKRMTAADALSHPFLQLANQPVRPAVHVNVGGTNSGAVAVVNSQPSSSAHAPTTLTPVLAPTSTATAIAADLSTQNLDMRVSGVSSTGATETAPSSTTFTQPVPPDCKASALNVAAAPPVSLPSSANATSANKDVGPSSTQSTSNPGAVSVGKTASA